MVDNLSSPSFSSVVSNCDILAIHDSLSLFVIQLLLEAVLVLAEVDLRNRICTVVADAMIPRKSINNGGHSTVPRCPGRRLMPLMIVYQYPVSLSVGDEGDIVVVEAQAPFAF